MSVIDLNTGEWLNDDGLLQRYGTDRARAVRTGEYSVLTGGQHCVETTINLVTLSALSTFGSDINVILDDSVTIPNGALIERVELTVSEVTAGSSATLDLGLVDQDRSTEIDFDGLIVAGTTTWHTAAIGTVVNYVQGSTEHGALVGTVLTNTGLLTAQVDGAAFTDGIIKVRIFYSIPHAADLTG